MPAPVQSGFRGGRHCGTRLPGRADPRTAAVPRPRGPRYAPPRFVVRHAAGSATTGTPGQAAVEAESGLAAAGRVPAQGGSASLARPMPAPAAAPGSAAGPAPSGTGPNVIISPAGGPHPGGALPIYDAVESDWFRARGRRVTGPGDPGAGRPGSEPQSWRSPGDEGWRAAAAIATPSVGGMTSAGLPRRVPRANLVPGSASDDQTRTATMAQSAQIARDRLANFQRGFPPGPHPGWLKRRSSSRRTAELVLWRRPVWPG
jgi:hypothetical protein